MAESEAEHTPQDLKCPLCLDIFNNPTLLGCGHSFCKKCLEERDSTQRALDHMDCPVCKEPTALDSRRVEGLAPNIAVKGVVDGITEKHTKFESRDLAPQCDEHKRSKELFCYDCSLFVCFHCWAREHEEHSITSKEDFDRKMGEKIDDFQRRCKDKEAELLKQIRATEEEKRKVISHMESVRMKIKAESEKKIKAIQENERSLLEKVESVEQEFCDKLDLAKGGGSGGSGGSFSPKSFLRPK